MHLQLLPGLLVNLLHLQNWNNFQMASQATCADGKTAKYSHPCCPSLWDFLGQGNFQMTHNEICPPQTLPKTFFAVPPLERNVMTFPFFPHQKLDRASHSPNQGLGRVLGQGPVDKSLEKLGLDSVRLQKLLSGRMWERALQGCPRIWEYCV